MFFCQKCKNFSRTDKCGVCGAQKLRQARENDPEYLTTKTFVYAGMLQEALRQNNIPFTKQEKHGGMLKYMGLGTGIEEFSFYIPFGAYKKAKEILAELFKARNSTRLIKNPALFRQAKRAKNRLR